MYTSTPAQGSQALSDLSRQATGLASVSRAPDPSATAHSWRPAAQTCGQHSLRPGPTVASCCISCTAKQKSCGTWPLLWCWQRYAAATPSLRRDAPSTQLSSQSALLTPAQMCGPSHHAQPDAHNFAEAVGARQQGPHRAAAALPPRGAASAEGAALMTRTAAGR